LFVTDEGLKSIDGMRAKRVPDLKSAGPGNRVAVADAASGKLVTSIPTGDGQIAPLLDSARNRLYVTKRGAGTVTVFDLKSHQLLHTIPLADHPNSLALDEKTGAVFVTIKSKQGTPAGSSEATARIALP
jgi:DNA-binding beta-propeller fold protein YncE